MVLKALRHSFGEIVRQIMLDAADADVGHGQPRAGQVFNDARNQLARFDHVKTDGDRAQLGSRHAATGQMIEHPRQLADDHANILATRRRFGADEFFHGQGVADIVDQRRGVIQPVGIGNDLGPGRLLAALVEAAMEKSDFDIAVEHLFAFELEIELDRAMGRRMGRPHLQFHDFASAALGYRLSCVA